MFPYVVYNPRIYYASPDILLNETLLHKILELIKLFYSLVG